MPTTLPNDLWRIIFYYVHHESFLPCLLICKQLWHLFKAKNRFKLHRILFLLKKAQFLKQDFPTAKYASKQKSHFLIQSKSLYLPPKNKLEIELTENEQQVMVQILRVYSWKGEDFAECKWPIVQQYIAQVDATFKTLSRRENSPDLIQDVCIVACYNRNISFTQLPACRLKHLQQLVDLEIGDDPFDSQLVVPAALANKYVLGYIPDKYKTISLWRTLLYYNVACFPYIPLEILDQDAILNVISRNYAWQFVNDVRQIEHRNEVARILAKRKIPVTNYAYLFSYVKDDVFKIALEEKLIGVNKRMKNGLSLLYESIKEKVDRTIIVELIQQGANVNADLENHLHCSPIFYSIASNDAELLQLVYEKGAQLPNDTSDLMPVAGKCSIAVAKLLQQMGFSITARVIYTSIYAGNTQLFEYLIGNYRNTMQLQNALGLCTTVPMLQLVHTHLHFDPSSVSLFSDPSLGSDKMEMPLFVAVSRNNFDMVQWYLSHGCSVKQFNAQGMSLSDVFDMFELSSMLTPEQLDVILE